MPGDDLGKEQLEANAPSLWKRFFAFACLISVAISAFTIFQSAMLYGADGARAGAGSLSWRLVTGTLISQSAGAASERSGILGRNLPVLAMKWEVDESSWAPGKFKADQAGRDVTLDPFLVTHLLFSFVAAFYALPLAMSLESTRNILVRLHKSRVLPNIPCWTNFLWLGIIAPCLVVIPVSGILTVNTSNFSTSHSIFGLASLLSGLAAVTLHYLVKIKSTGDLSPLTRLATVRHIVNSLFLFLSITATVTGFSEPSKAVARLAQAFSLEYVCLAVFGLTSILTITSIVCVLDGYLAVREQSRGRAVGNIDSKEVML